jgi:hypothetical protein
LQLALNGLSILLAFAAISLVGVALGQSAATSPVVSDVPVAGGTERVLFLGGQQARAIVVLLPAGRCSELSFRL